MPIPQPTVHQQTPGVDSLQAMTQALGMMSQTFRDYAKLSEEINQFDVGTQGKLFNELLNSDKYSGDMGQLLTEHETLGKNFLTKLMRGDKNAADKMFNDIKKAPKTAEERGRLAGRLYDLTAERVEEDRQQQQNQQQNQTLVGQKAPAKPEETPPGKDAIPPAAGPAAKTPPIQFPPSPITKTAGVNPLTEKVGLIPGSIMQQLWGSKIGSPEGKAKQLTDDAIRAGKLSSQGEAALFYEDTLKKLKSQASSGSVVDQLRNNPSQLGVTPEGKFDFQKALEDYKNTPAASVVPPPVQKPETPPKGPPQTVAAGAEKPQETDAEYVARKATKPVAEAAQVGLSALANGETPTPKAAAAVRYVVRSELKGSAKAIADSINASMDDPEYMNKLKDEYVQVFNMKPSEMNVRQLQMLGKDKLNLLIGQGNLAKLQFENSQEAQSFKDLERRSNLEKAELEFVRKQAHWAMQQYEWMTRISAGKDALSPQAKLIWESSERQERAIYDAALAGLKDPQKANEIIADIESGKLKDLHKKVMDARAMRADIAKSMKVPVNVIGTEYGGLNVFGAQLIPKEQGTSIQIGGAGGFAPMIPANTSVGVDYAKRNAGR